MKQENHYQICNRCIMDTSDPEISFDDQGVCSHCKRFDTLTEKSWFPNEEGSRRLNEIVQKVKNEGKDKEYDCILGLSGGIDSSYLAYQAKILGLRPLIMHVDAGWNSEIAVKNIENVCRNLDFELFTHVVDWEEIKDLQLAFLRSGVANQDVPQDHAFFAALYGYAVKNKIKYVLNGSNFATEGILPTSWGYDSKDLKHIQGIHARFGSRPLRTYPTMSFFDIYFLFPFVYKMKILTPLNYMPYSKELAMQILHEKLGWRYYGAKHGESRFTKFFQRYYLPTRFGYDKNRAHLSSLVVSGQLTRSNALKEVDLPLYDSEELRLDKEFVLKKLGLSQDEFESIMKQPLRTFRDYPSNYEMHNNVRIIVKSSVGLINSIRRNIMDRPR